MAFSNKLDLDLFYGCFHKTLAKDIRGKNNPKIGFKIQFWPRLQNDSKQTSCSPNFMCFRIKNMKTN